MKTNLVYLSFFLMVGCAAQKPLNADASYYEKIDAFPDEPAASNGTEPTEIFGRLCVASVFRAKPNGSRAGDRSVEKKLSRPDVGHAIYTTQVSRSGGALFLVPAGAKRF